MEILTQSQYTFTNPGCPIICGFWQEEVISPQKRREWMRRMGGSVFEVSIPGLHGQTRSHSETIVQKMRAGFEDIDRKM